MKSLENVTVQKISANDPFELHLFISGLIYQMAEMNSNIYDQDLLTGIGEKDLTSLKGTIDLQIMINPGVTKTNVYY